MDQGKVEGTSRVLKNSVEIVYTDAKQLFSVASFMWKNGGTGEFEPRIGMRWHDTATGFPSMFGKPQWFVLPKGMALAYATQIGNTELKAAIEQMESK